MPLSSVKENRVVLANKVLADKVQFVILPPLKRPVSSLSSVNPVTEEPDVLGGPHQNPDPVHQAKPSEDPAKHLTLKEIIETNPNRASEEKRLEFAAYLAEWKAPEVAEFHKRVSSFTAEFGRPHLNVQTWTPETLAAAEASKKKHPDTPFWNHVDILKHRRVKNPDGKGAWNKFVESQESTWKCEICLLTGDHMSLECPYLDYVPNDAIVGPGVDVRCKSCSFKGEHDSSNCVKRAYRMHCCICGAEHWTTTCPFANEYKRIHKIPLP